MSVARAQPLESLSVGNWLAELHMECYKRNLENYDTIKPLLDMKESELKKLGIHNSKDRSRMLGSLAKYNTDREESSPVSVHATPIQVQAQESHKSLLRKSSLKKINLKSLLGSGSSKKGKKKDEISSTSVPTVTEIGSPETTSKPPSSGIADYEELPSPPTRSMTMDTKVLQTVTRKAIENEYVPSPENSPRSDSHRLRAQTMVDYSYTHSQQGGVGNSSYIQSQSSTPEMNHHNRIQHQGVPEDDLSNLLKHKHLSVNSMESGLSFGYDVEKDFNPALPLEVQPWFHGKISRADAENMLHDDGDFLVRENTLMPNTYTLTQRWGGTPDHTLIGTTEVVNSKTDLMRATAVKYQFEGGAFDSIPELIFNHFKYQIPIEKTQHTLITNPICRASNSSKGGLPPTMGTSAVSYAPQHQHHMSTPDSSPTHNTFTLPRNFGSKQQKFPSPPPEAFKTTSRSTRPTPESSPRIGPTVHKHYNSSGDILDATAREESSDVGRNVISPPPAGTNLRIRAMTASHPLRRSSSSTSEHSLSHVGSGSDDNCHKRMDSFGDYEMMESVSILNGSPVGLQVERSKTVSAGSSPQHSGERKERVKYAEIRYRGGSTGKGGRPAFSIAAETGSVKYAEVRFRHNQGSSSDASPHPFSTYDTVPVKNTSPYQSRAEILAQKMNSDSKYSTPSPSLGGKSSHSRIGRQDSSPHPFSQYSSIQYASINHFPRQTSTPAGVGGSPVHSRRGPPTAATDAVLYAVPDLGRKKKDRESTASNDSALSTASSQSSPGPSHLVGTALANIHSHAPAAKVHRSLPGYEMLVKLHTVLQSHSNEELAYHLTRADATCFMLTPRPGEDTAVWKDRVKQTVSSSGLFTGLQTLADPDGEKLWKKLYHRHLNFSQTVSLSIVSAGDALERVKMLRRFIEIGSMMQSGNYGNLFSFIAIMQGIASPQITDMTDVWDLLGSHYPEAVATHKELRDTITHLNEGISMYATDQLTVPAIQHLKTVFHFSEQSMHGYAPVTEDRSLVGEYSSLACGLDGIRTIVANVAQFSFNARRKLDGLRYDASLMDFFMQDTTRMYLQSISVHVDSPIERRRRFGVLLNALVERVESCESV